MKGMMLNEHVGLETATLNRMKARTARNEFRSKNLNTQIFLELLSDDNYMKTTGNLDFDGVNTFRIDDCYQGYEFKTKYAIGEVVAIKQSYEDIYHSMRPCTGKDEYKKQYSHLAGWTNKMFVKNDLMPHQVKITEIKLERLQDISSTDCLREGVRRSGGVYYLPSAEKDMSAFDSPRKAFAALIDYACGKGTWKRNDINVVYYYNLVK